MRLALFEHRDKRGGKVGPCGCDGNIRIQIDEQGAVVLIQERKVDRKPGGRHARPAAARRQHRRIQRADQRLALLRIERQYFIREILQVHDIHDALIGVGAAEYQRTGAGLRDLPGHIGPDKIALGAHRQRGKRILDRAGGRKVHERQRAQVGILALPRVPQHAVGNGLEKGLDRYRGVGRKSRQQMRVAPSGARLELLGRDHIARVRSDSVRRFERRHQARVKADEVQRAVRRSVGERLC